MLRRGFRGSLVEAMREGIIATAFIHLVSSFRGYLSRANHTTETLLEMSFLVLRVATGAMPERSGG
jgi:hypothetical protein